MYGAYDACCVLTETGLRFSSLSSSALFPKTESLTELASQQVLQLCLSPSSRVTDSAAMLGFKRNRGCWGVNLRSLCLCVCARVCVVYAHTCVGRCTCACAEAGMIQVLFLSLCLTPLSQGLSPKQKALAFWLGLQPANSRPPSAPPQSRGYRYLWNHIWHWCAGIHTMVLMVTQQIL